MMSGSPGEREPLHKGERESRQRLAIIVALLRGIEHRELVDSAVWMSRDDADLRDQLGMDPLRLSGIELDAVLAMTIGNRSERTREELIAERKRLLERLDASGTADQT